MDIAVSRESLEWEIQREKSTERGTGWEWNSELDFFQGYWWAGMKWECSAESQSSVKSKVKIFHDPFIFQNLYLQTGTQV